MMNPGVDAEKREPLCIVGRIVNRYKPYGKQYGGFSKKLKVELLYYSAIPLLGINPNEMKTLTRKDIFTPMFIATLFTVAKTWKQPKCPSMNEWIKKL